MGPFKLAAILSSKNFFCYEYLLDCHLREELNNILNKTDYIILSRNPILVDKPKIKINTTQLGFKLINKTNEFLFFRKLN